MDLKKFDDKLVRLTDLNDDVWEGYVFYCGEEYCEHEFGKYEECLQMVHTLFFKNQIKNVEEIEEFSEPYGLLEESTLEDGLSLIDEVFECENDEHILRLLLCINDHLHKNDLENKEELAEAIKKLADRQCKKLNIDKDKLIEELNK